MKTAELDLASPPKVGEEMAELIRRRAYELFEQRGREDGHDIDDWIAAESEVLRNFVKEVQRHSP